MAPIIIHPMWVEDWIRLELPQAGVHVMGKVDGPALPLWDWIEARLASPRLPGKETLRQAVAEYKKGPRREPGAESGPLCPKENQLERKS